GWRIGLGRCSSRQQPREQDQHSKQATLHCCAGTRLPANERGTQCELRRSMAPEGVIPHRPPSPIADTSSPDRPSLRVCTSASPFRNEHVALSRFQNISVGAGLTPLSPSATDNRPAKFLDYRFSCAKLCFHPSVCSGNSVAHA